MKLRITKEAASGWGANVEGRLVSKLIKSGRYERVVQFGIKASHFHGNARHVFKYVADYFDQYGKVPEASVLRRRFPKFKLVSNLGEPLKAIADELKDREHYNSLLDTIQESGELLPTSTSEAHKRIVQGLERLSDLQGGWESADLSATDSLGPKAYEPVSLGREKEPQIEEGFLGGLIAPHYPTTLFGDGGQGKSYVAMGIAMAIAAGKPFLGYNLPSGPALYIDWELSLTAQTRRAFSLARGMGMTTPPKKLLYLSAPNSLPKMMARIRGLIKKRGIVFVVIDSFGPACGGNPEAAEGVMPLFNELRKLGVTVLILDHQAKMQEGQSYSKKTPFGSAYKVNLSRSVIQLQRVASQEGELKLMLRHTKNNLGPMLPDSGLSILFKDKTSPSVSIVSANMSTDADFMEHRSAPESILLSLKEDGPGTKNELSERTGIKLKTIENVLPKLRRDGKISELPTKTGRQTVYQVPPTPRPYSSGGVGMKGLKLRLKMKRK